MKNDQNGFSTGLILLAVVVLSVIGLSVWMVMRSGQSSDKPQVVKSNNTDNAKSTDNVTEENEQKQVSADWLLRESSQASIRIPDGFTILARDEEPFGFIAKDNPEGSLQYTRGTTATIAGGPAGSFSSGLQVGFNEKGLNDRGTELKRFKTYSGLEVVQKLFEQTNDPEGIDFEKGTKHYKHTVIKGDNFVNVDYSYVTNDQLDIIEEMVKTVTIN